MSECLVAPRMILLLVMIVLMLLRLTMMLLRIRLLEFVGHARLHISLMARPAIDHHMLALLLIMTKYAVRVMRGLRDR